MRRLVAITGLVALVAAIVTALSMAAPAGKTGSQATLPPKPRLPALPGEVRSRGKFLIGVKCDFPPFGWQDTSGRNRGYDVDTARQFAAWAFGSRSKVDFTCTTTASRIPTLQSKRVDFIISTLTWTAQRELTIDYSLPYYGAAGKLLVKNSVIVGRLNTWMRGKTITTTPGSIYDRWIKNCFKDTTLLVVSSPSSGVLAVKDGRADALMFDDAFLVGVAANAPDLRLTNHKFLDVPWGVGIRKNEPEMKRWVDTAIRGMKARDLFWKIMQRTIPRRFYTTFKQNVPRPKNTLKYPRGTVPESACPS
ncbi:MAG: transporter substrate-binding domain-containing protein [Actinobacteria bacterium]|nr:transporter substrate-binding domain-containing protein [Actinomycetota bacterium]